MIIKLNNNYFIEGNKYSYDLKRTVISEKTGNEYSDTIGYYPNVALALKKYAEVSVAATEEEITLDEFIKRYEALVQEVLEIGKK
jgi:hypothetical protein